MDQKKKISVEKSKKHLTLLIHFHYNLSVATMNSFCYYDCFYPSVEVCIMDKIIQVDLKQPIYYSQRLYEKKKR
jgi:hypothetical protein